MGKHIFSIYYKNISKNINEDNINSKIELKDKKTHNRITQILRLNVDDVIILFDKQINIKAKILKETFDSNKFIHLEVLEKNNNKKLKPEIILCPSLIKKHSFEDLIYNATTMGATIIRPTITEKSQRKWGFEKEKERLEKIMISACEQSKNYTIPELHKPVKLPMLLKGLENLAGKKIFFESDQHPLIEALSQITSLKNGKVCLLFGPEGGLTKQEILLLKTKEFIGCSLTKTILRSQEAVCLGIGIVRSILR